MVTAGLRAIACRLAAKSAVALADCCAVDIQGLRAIARPEAARSRSKKSKKNRRPRHRGVQ